MATYRCSLAYLFVAVLALVGFAGVRPARAQDNDSGTAQVTADVDRNQGDHSSMHRHWMNDMDGPWMMGTAENRYDRVPLPLCARPEPWNQHDELYNSGQKSHMAMMAKRWHRRQLEAAGVPWAKRDRDMERDKDRDKD